jgi:hypothetical protein
MKWKFTPRTPKPKPSEGDTKKRTTFLLIPTVIDRKWVWLELVNKVYTYKYVTIVCEGGGCQSLEWVHTGYELKEEK